MANHEQMPFCVCVLLVIKPRALYMASQVHTTGLYLQPLHFYFFRNLLIVVRTLNVRSILLANFFFLWWDWGLNSGLCTCKAVTLLLEPHLQSILLWLFWRWGSLKLFASASLEP
jgi:hypothetical protein